jgi:hypothetical protein
LADVAILLAYTVLFIVAAALGQKWIDARPEM